MNKQKQKLENNTELHKISKNGSVEGKKMLWETIYSACTTWL